MADSLFDILSQKNFDAPPEIAAIKQYVHEHFNENVEVIIRNQNIVIAAPSAALAGSLRLHAPKLKQAANTSKRIVLRIG